MSNRPAKNRDSKDSLDFVLEQRSVFSGPLPPLETLKGYGTIDPQYPERIFKLAEEYTRAEIKGKDTESRALILGMILSFIVSLAGLGSCLFLALKGMTAESITAAVTGFSPVLINAISNLKKSP
jgi:uncharacterized membrane protein